jgi:cell division protein FtsL
VNIQTLLVIVAVLLVLIFWELRKMNSRLKNRFPTEKEQDYEWSQDDPQGHREAHIDDEKSRH